MNRNIVYIFAGNLNQFHHFVKRNQKSLMTFKRITSALDLSGRTDGILLIVGTAKSLLNYKDIIYTAQSRGFKIVYENEFNSLGFFTKPEI